MGEDLAPMTFSLPVNIDFEVGDYAMVYGETYKLKDTKDFKKSSSIEYDYVLTLKGKMYDLQDILYKFPDANNQYTLTGQPLMGNLETFVDLLITNANIEQSGWVKGVIDDTDFQELTFNADENCLSVLTTLFNAFKIEWWVEGQTIHFTKRGEIENIPLSVGKGNGLYFLQRSASTTYKFVTRLYCYGAERNIPADYKGFSNRLKLPGDLPYLENNVYKNNDPAQGKKYGVIEDTVVFEDIYPRRLGLVTQVGDKITFTDSQIDFNVNTQLLAVSAKVQFQTGNLAGNTFELNSFDNTTKQFTLKYNTSDKDFVLPSDVLKPAVGDQYILLDIAMPQSYITNAENEVLARGADQLSAYSVPPLAYSLDFDPLDLARKNRTLKLGNYLPIDDVDFKIDQPIRLIAFTRDFQVEYLYKGTLADTTNISPLVANRIANENLTKKVERIGKTSNRAYNDALQAKATADGVKLITDFWGVTIDAEHGIVAAGTLLVGSGPVNNGGITGVTDAGDLSVRAFFGASYENKNTAVWRVLQNGKMFSSDAVITGVITATSGKIGNFNIDGNGLTNISNVDAYIQQVKTFTGGSKAGFKLGTGFSQGEVTNATYAAYIFNNENREFEADGVTRHVNVGLYVEASGALDVPGLNANVAAIFKGPVQFIGRVYTQIEPGHTGPGWDGFGWSGNIVYKGGGGENRHLTVINGFIVNEAEGNGP